MQARRYSYDDESCQYTSAGQFATGGYQSSSSAQQQQKYYQSSSSSLSSAPQYAAAAGAVGYQSSSSSLSSAPQYAAVGYGGGYGQQQQQQQMHKASSFSSSSSSSSSKTQMTVFGTDPFCEIMPSAFPPGTDPKVVQCFNRIDRDGNGVVDDRELQAVLSSCNQSFSLRTVHLLMFQFTHSNKRMIGPKEFVPLLNSLQSWRAMFTRFDRDRNGTIDSVELGTALTNLGFRVSPIIVNLLVAKFSKSGGKCSLHYDNFIECCLTVKGLTETFNAKADQCGKANFNYEEFLLNVLPYVIA